MSSLPETQKAVALPAKRTPFIQLTTRVHPPSAGEVVIRVQWTASSPLDLHFADGGLLISDYPFLMGNGGAAGVVAAVGKDGDLKGLQVGDRVMSFAFHGGKEANNQEYITVPAYMVSKIPEGFTLQEAVTVPVNLVTVFHAATRDLELGLPWPIPGDWTPSNAQRPILIWGASSSVGIFAIQVLKHWGYTNILAVASEKHHAYLRSIGATASFDYRKDDVVEKIQAYTKDEAEPKVPSILDCIGSLEGTLRPLTKIAQRGSRLGAMLPIILKDATEESEPEYEMDVSNCLVGEWAEGALIRGVRTHFYLEVSYPCLFHEPQTPNRKIQNEFFKEKLQSEIIPALLKEGIVTPNRQRIVEGETVVERAQNALDILRKKDVSGEKLVWRVSEE